ncbi:hypothetical protein HPG69_005130 [Diceros bicornis minor]|uniref:EF-hand domain-containing protein n=1 Tax=Diceros bicornis minor TaxID=77932 RepID=A0A7J7EG06_DICBM|nr:hypothetical protein HPG69_005130 [Diceros bicornis minor]
MKSQSRPQAWCSDTIDEPVIFRLSSRIPRVMLRSKIREAFRVLDRDGNGFISKQELGMAMRSLGYMPSEVELAIIMQRLDMDGEPQAGSGSPERALTRQRDLGSVVPTAAPGAPQSFLHHSLGNKGLKTEKYKLNSSSAHFRFTFKLISVLMWMLWDWLFYHNF